jgi:hypothetical protein
MELLLIFFKRSTIAGPRMPLKGIFLGKELPRSHATDALFCALEATVRAVWSLRCFVFVPGALTASTTPTINPMTKPHENPLIRSPMVFLKWPYSVFLYLILLDSEANGCLIQPIRHYLSDYV